ncbi:MerR family transcriptional regulator [Amycolatopsis sp. YIM 10]|uniref:MerR family transcriptional regulator n=1 Tax=Amycolatopsis sp. YIM 10 TaxID=2653857 RepID=UPI0012907B52|nr:MerR family transcriptional regulator [Amycolatopsis sp. YIM 10]QFU86816.1 Nodulation protein NolA [Amycolatopsis sp. YIM 10]
MHGDALVPIGELARLTGLTVKAIRFYSNSGIVTPAERSPAGYRLYDNEAVARLQLVRTLRALGLDLPTVRKVVDQELSLPRVAAAHAAALDVQIQTLRLRRSLLTAAARRGTTPEELELMHRLATLSETERRLLTDEFLGTVFDGLDTHPAFTGVIRSMTPELPDDPTEEQIQAWVELAELCQDNGFRARMQEMAQNLAAERSADATGLPRSLAEAVRSLVEPALAEEIDPTAPAAEPIVTALTAHYAHIVNRPDDHGLRRQLASQLETMNDPRRDRYLCLLAVVNGWSAPDSLAPVLDWAVRALRFPDN